MPLTAPVKQQSDDFKIVPAGTHIAVARVIADLGTQPGSGMYPQPRPQVYIGFEIPGERVTYTKDGKELDGPMNIGKTYTLSLSEKANLRKDLQAWRGKTFTDEEAATFDVASVVGKACMVTVAHKDRGEKTYANIISVAGMPKGVPAPKLEGEAVVFVDNDAHELAKLPQWLRDKIAAQLDAQPHTSGRQAADDAMAHEHASMGREDFADEIPF